MTKHTLIVTCALTCIIFTLCSQSHISTKTSWKLNQEKLFLVPGNNNYPDEISWCIADLKFDGTSVKVCEFGEGRYSQFNGHEALFGTGKLWEEFWYFLSTFNLPIWLVHNSPQISDFKTQARDTLAHLGGKRVATINKIPQPIQSKNRSCKQPVAHTNIAILESLAWRQAQFEQACTQNPHLLVIGRATNYFFRTKHGTNQLFTDTGIAHYKPLFRQYAKPYSKNIAQKILQDFATHTCFVIKPVSASCGYGIIIVEAKDLDSTLYTILSKNRTTQKKSNDHSYSYWNHDPHKHFIIEAYAPSKPIIVNHKSYDATMRVIFSLFNMNGKMGIYFFDAYWKLPPRALSEKGTLNDLHKSHIEKGKTSSAPVDALDFARVKQKLTCFLPMLYEKALIHTFKEHKHLPMPI